MLDSTPAPWLDDFHVFVYGRPAVDYMQEVGGTAVSWSVYAVGVSPEERAYVDELHAAGVRVNANLPTMQGYPAFTGGDPALAERVACRTFDGELARAFWIQPDPPLLPCHNNPEWREFLLAKVLEQIDGAADGIQIDEVEGIGGHLYLAGFCEWCMAGFRDYLSRSFCAGDLETRFGITDIDSFDYGVHLRAAGATSLADDMNPELRREYIRFQLLSRREQLEEMIAAGREYAGTPVAFSANVVVLHALRLPHMPLLDLAVYETSLDDLPEGNNLALHFLGRSLAPGKKMVMFPDIVELAALEPEDWPLVAHWYAEAVAAGASVLVPHQAYTFGGGVYHVEASALAPYTAWARAVHEEASRTQPAATVAVLYDFGVALENYYADGYVLPLLPGAHHARVMEVGSALAREHVPFEILYVGDGDLVDRPLDASALAPYASVIIAAPDALEPAEHALIDAHEAGGAAVFRIDDGSADALATLASEVRTTTSLPVVTDAPPSVAVVPWTGPDVAVVYLVNYDYDPTTHTFVPVGPFTLDVVATGLTGSAVLLAPGAAEVPLAVSPGPEGFTVTVDQVVDAAAVILR